MTIFKFLKGASSTTSNFNLKDGFSAVETTLSLTTVSASSE